MSIKTYNKEKIDEMYKECKEIIEITAFPTVNIKTDALYILNGDKIYRYINNEWVELISEATDDIFGVVKYDDDTIKKNTDKQLYAVDATNTQKGVVKYDNETIQKNTDEQLYVREATDELTGVVKYDDDTIKKNTDKQLYVVDQDRVIEISDGSEGTVTAEQFEKLAKGSYSLKSGVYIYKLTGSQDGKLYFETLYSLNEDEHTVGQITIDSNCTWTRMTTTIEKSDGGGVIEVPTLGYVLTDEEYEKIKTGKYSLRLPDGRQFDPMFMDDTNGEYHFGQTRSFASGVVTCSEICISYLAKQVNNPIEGQIGYPDNITIKKAADNSIHVPNATDSQKGVVKIDDDTIKINSSGQIYSVGGGLTPILLESGATSGTLTDEEVASLGINTILNLDNSYYRYSKGSGVLKIYENRMLDKTKAGSENCKRITVNASNNTWTLENGLTLYPIDNNTIKVNNDGKMYANITDTTIIELSSGSGTLTDTQYNAITQNPEKFVLKYAGYYHRLTYQGSSSYKYTCCYYVSSTPPYVYAYNIDITSDKKWKFTSAYIYQYRYRHIITCTHVICDIITTRSSAYTTEDLAKWLKDNGFKDTDNVYPCCPRYSQYVNRGSSSKYELPMIGIISTDGKLMLSVHSGLNGVSINPIPVGNQYVISDKVLTIY